MISADAIGYTVDRICNNTRRDVREVAGRLIEEVAEFAAECGVTPAKMRGHLEDSIHNMCLKQSYADGRTVFPSQFDPVLNPLEAVKEGGDILLLLNDALYLLGFLQSSAEKWAEIKYKALVTAKPGEYTSINGSTFYRVKAHVK